MDWSALKSPRKWSAWSLKDYGRLQVWRRPHIWFEFRVSADLNPATLGLSPVASAQQCCQTNHAEPHNRQAPRLGDIWRRSLGGTCWCRQGTREGRPVPQFECHGVNIGFLTGVRQSRGVDCQCDGAATSTAAGHG